MSSIRPYVPKRLKKSTADKPASISPEIDCGKSPHELEKELSAETINEEELNSSSQRLAAPDANIVKSDTIEFIQKHKSASFKNSAPKSCISKICAHKNAVNCIRWGKGSSRNILLSASMDGKIGISNFCKDGIDKVREVGLHIAAVKDARWSSCGKRILSGGYDKHARISDAETGKQISCFNHKNFVTSVLFHPENDDLFLGGTSNSGIFAWDTRADKQIHHYKSFFGQVQDILFHPDGKTFFSAAEILKRNSLDKAIIAWDFDTTAVMSNQISQEAFGCTCLQNHPTDSVFLAQYGSGYTTIFSNSSPYKLNKYKRFEGHQTAGFRIGFTISPDGSCVITGDRDGKIHAYDYKSSRLIRTLDGFASACMDVDFHPTLPTVIAACSWGGELSIWQ